MSDRERDPINIIVCSDGTGNTAIKGRGSNVFKLYEAVDTRGHLDDPARSRQVAIYDDGIGTQKLKLIRQLAGAFGWGFKRNVRHLYIEIARAYRPGDRIHVFGFSRGAFTVRTLAGLIAEYGIIKDGDTLSDTKLRQRARAAYRSMRGKVPGVFQLLLNWTLDHLPLPERVRYPYKATDFHASHGAGTEVEFVGVWDTVAAVGFPLATMSTLWNWLVYRIDMPGRALHPNVKRAAHALALDDQRWTFTPLLWKEDAAWETDERDLTFTTVVKRDLKVFLANRRDELRRLRGAGDAVDTPRVTTNDPRIDQVWFAGMHSNVGGGYEKQGMSLVALEWMMAMATSSSPTLRFHAEHERDIRARANVADTLYDSRSGSGVVYRFKPRPISQLLIRNAAPARIHWTALSRALDRPGGYVPWNLPHRFQIATTPGCAAPDGLTDGTVASLTIPAEARARLAWSSGLTFVRQLAQHGLYVVLIGVLIAANSASQNGGRTSGSGGESSGMLADALGYVQRMAEAAVGPLPASDTIRARFVTPLFDEPLLGAVFVGTVIVVYLVGLGARLRSEDLWGSIWHSTTVVNEKTGSPIQFRTAAPARPPES